MAQQPTRTVQTQVLGGVDRPKSSAGAKVTVACNIPNGIRIRAYRMVPATEPVMGGGVRTTERAEPVSESVLIKGPGHEIDKAPRAAIIGKTDLAQGYAITTGVDKELWDNWYSYNKDSQLVRNRCIFAFEKRNDTLAMARESEGNLSGLEPFTPDIDPRRPRSRPELTAVTSEEEQRERRRNEILVEDYVDVVGEAGEDAKE